MGACDLDRLRGTAGRCRDSACRVRRLGARPIRRTATRTGRVLEVRRTLLGAEPAEWPAPIDRPSAHWRGYYLGVLDGAEPQLPADAGTPWGHSQGSAYG